MKRSNGTGTVVKLSGNRRKPWMVKVPEYNTFSSFTGRQIPIGYFSTRPEADFCLAEYNKSHGIYDADKMQYTFADVYNDFKREKFPTKEEQKIMKETRKKIIGKLGISNMWQISGSYKNSQILWNRKYVDLRKHDFESVVYSVKDLSPSKLNHIISFFRKMDQYAMEQGIITMGYAQFLEIIPEEVQRPKVPFSTAEIEKIWEHQGNIIADIVLVLLYTCMRINELLELETKNILLDDNYMIGGLKTEAGKDRIIPIHHIIKPIILKYFNSNNKYLFTDENGNKIEYATYRIHFNDFMNQLNMDHISHEARLTGRSELDRKGANKICIDRILGHKSQGIGEQKYTDKTIEELIETIELITYNIKNNGFRVLSKTM